MHIKNSTFKFINTAYIILTTILGIFIIYGIINTMVSLMYETEKEMLDMHTTPASVYIKQDLNMMYVFLAYILFNIVYLLVMGNVKIKRSLTILAILLGLVGCSSYKNEPYVVYLNDEVEESLKPMKDYCIYDFSSNMKGTMDYEVCIPAHYQIWIPPKKDIKYIHRIDNDRCFLYTKSRGIAIFQDIPGWARKYANGFRPIASDSVESYLSQFGDQKKLKVKAQKNHYLYVDDEIRIVFFNLSQEDYHSFVETPLKSLNIKRRGEIWSKYELNGCEVQIKVQPHHVQKWNDGHGPTYALSTPKGYFILTNAANTKIDFDKYKIIKNDTVNGIYSRYGVNGDLYFREDFRPKKDHYVRVFYADVMAKDTCEFNRIMDSIIINSIIN